MDTRSLSGARLVAFARMDTAPLGKALQDLIGQGGANLRLLAEHGVTHPKAACRSWPTARSSASRAR
jgi:hypothetical protein